MPIRNASPLHFSPHSASDAIDATNIDTGAMALLQNLIPDPSTANLWQCRPAAQKLTSFQGVTSPGFVSVLQVIGNNCYGMIASGLNPGHDQPFAFNLLTGAFTSISGITAANTPVSPPTTGAWTPPTMAVVGGTIIVTHPGFNFGGGFAFGVLNISNPATPTWTAQNTTTNALAALPSFVANFNQRAWFLVNIPNGQPGAYFSDVLGPTTITNANQVITFDDNQQLTAAAGLGLSNQLGGVVQALLVFKSTANVYQITGDALLSNLSRNSLNVATGTLAPNGIANTPLGIAFIAPDGLRIIDFNARISDPIGVDGRGINVPFIFNVVPSRAQAVSNQNVLRLSVQNGLAPGAPNQEWWFDLSRKKWSGPHTFPASMIEPWNNTFVMTPIGVTASLWQSDVAQSSTSQFVENGQQMTFTWQTAMLPDPALMSYFAMSETTLNLALVSGESVFVQAQDQNGNIFDSLTISAGGTQAVWGHFNWGQAFWGGAQLGLFPHALEWKKPIVFRRLAIQATGNSVGSFKIGDLFLRYQKLGYMVVDPASTVEPFGVGLTTDSGIPLTTEGGQRITAG